MPAAKLRSSTLGGGRRHGFFLAAAILAIVASAGRSTTVAQEKERKPRLEKLDQRLRERVQRDDRQLVRVIIQADPASRESRKRAWATQGRWHADHASIGAMTATVTAEELEALAADDTVRTVSLDAEVNAQQTFTDGPVLRDTLGLRVGGGLASARTYDGDKIVVAVVDSGIAPAKDIEASRIVAFFDFTRGGVRVAPFDDYGHGTHIAGLIGGNGALSKDRFAGAAPKARFVGYKVLDGSGAGRTSDVVAAIEHAVAHRQALGIRVINLSLGHSILESAATDPLVRAVERAVAAGLVVVVSAGNTGERPGTGLPGFGGITSPGNAPSAITVGATDVRGTVARADDIVPVFSSRGPSWFDGYAKPDVVAPGYRLVGSAALGSTLYGSQPSFLVAGISTKTLEYMRLSGTSMAAGVTSGVVTLMLQARDTKYPTRPLSANLVKAILQQTAIPVPGAHVLEQGAGSINPLGAVRLVEAINPTAPAGTVWLTKAVSPSDAYGGALSAWSQTLVWGDHLLDGRVVQEASSAWGTSIVWGDALVWGNTMSFSTRDTSVVWGDALTWGNSVVWGNTALGVSNGTSIVWGDALVWGSAAPSALRWWQPSGGVTGTATAQTSPGR